ncbi:deoxyguanosinetriphosphate triphosphohydrolase [Rhizobacter sp. AJA081-3]|uniref:deoxyguanosinetriphosphate triphosphohydrolase n=1 Tax=Rhizobacter sp. AJA081-3 TaxID=2753607 RepID=UPI001AE05FB4|nr:deoxyguanosinetriphosphate triphosphohydrolase [Rhizobacter sp. AJA081-3]QTN21884.1 deoxyguanosinetriphosphate triphosphohydrolase [Rhizobacter sp. AJA081-3]
MSERAPYASDPMRSRGRRHPLLPDAHRCEFQRDRDRIVHSTAFRRLVYKTQVFLNHEGDLFRTRMTHSLEVAQLARSIARRLRLHEDLCEAIALAHDLGHTPFGHAGQEALDAAYRAAAPDAGGFEHNYQSLRVVDVLEERYPEHDGLNLCFETREGILKHCSRRHAEAIEREEPGGVGRRFLDRTQPSLEAQLANLADAIAYNAHDIDDGVRAGLLDYEQLLEVPLLDQLHRDAVASFPTLTGRRLLYALMRGLIAYLVDDTVDTTEAAIRRYAPAHPQDVRRLPPMVGMGSETETSFIVVQQLLRERLYRHPRVWETTRAAQCVVSELFAAYLDSPQGLPAAHRERMPLETAVVDYIAGMTDRFALREHARVLGPGPLTARLS